MYVFQHSFIEDDNIVFTMDTDAFLIGNTLLKSFAEPHQVWISEWVFFFLAGNQLYEL